MTELTRRSLAALVLAAAPGWARGAAADEELLAGVHPQFQPYALLIRQLGGMAPLSAATLAERRQPAQRFGQPAAASPPVSERTIPGPRGAPNVRVQVINAGGGGKPAILHMHGGGFVLGSAGESVRMLQDIARALDCVIVSVDYRLAPETRFPGPLEDNYAGLKWLHANAEALGADRTRIAVMGESAGGGHAAMLAIAARDRGEVPVVFQALTYPMLDDRTGSTRRVPPHIGRILWREVDNRFGWSALLGVPAGSVRVPAGAVPARLADLRGLPPAFIAVGSIDLFVDEDIDYARRLVAAGVPAELHVYPGAFHAFNVTATEISRTYNAALIAALKGAFERRA